MSCFKDGEIRHGIDYCLGCASVRLPDLHQLQEKERFEQMSIVRELVPHGNGVSWAFGRI